MLKILPEHFAEIIFNKSWTILFIYHIYIPPISLSEQFWAPDNQKKENVIQYYIQKEEKGRLNTVEQSIL